MKAKKVTKTGTARALLADNPNINAKQLADKMGISEQYAYGILWKLKQPPRVKRTGRMPKTVSLNKAQFDFLNTISDGRRRMRTIEAITSSKPIADMVNHPAHYKVGGIETIDFIEAKKLSYNLGNVVKYITRANHKGNRKEDLEKARWYLNRELSSLEK